MQRDPWPITVDWLESGWAGWRVTATCTPSHYEGHPNHPDNLAPECVLTVIDRDEMDVTDSLSAYDHDRLVAVAWHKAGLKAEGMEDDHA